jgi:hypothetical protein
MNLEQIKAKLAGLSEKRTGGIRPWRPKGEHTVRLLHPPGYEDPFIERAYHYDIGNDKTILCPRCFGEDCDICETADLMKSWKDENGVDKPEARRKAEFEIFRKLQARPRYWCAMVEIGKESDGAQWWSITENSYKQVLKICTNADFNEDHPVGGSAILTDTAKGINVIVDFKKPGERGNDKTFPETTITPRMKFTKLDNAEGLLKSLPALEDLDPRVPSSEVARKFRMSYNSDVKESEVDQKAGGEYGGGSKDSSAAKDADKGEQPTKAASNNGERLVGKKNVDEALSEILNS